MTRMKMISLPPMSDHRKLVPGFLRRVPGNAVAGRTRGERRNHAPSSKLDCEHADAPLGRILGCLLVFGIGALIALAALILFVASGLF